MSVNEPRFIFSCPFFLFLGLSIWMAVKSAASKKGSRPFFAMMASTMISNAGMSTVTFLNRHDDHAPDNGVGDLGGGGGGGGGKPLLVKEALRLLEGWLRYHELGNADALGL